ncbi:hypothetical protein ANN_05738 [Periplaneta americana]|uniref:Uncharacterized protein n=1 Tax=Periplaneta americana TaxID=6978 RepID=A0ABQ8TBR5_PERAM|nr:hypothetical protein ANN_05738 [Periplaneta americana]
MRKTKRTRRKQGEQGENKDNRGKQGANGKQGKQGKVVTDSTPSRPLLSDSEHEKNYRALLGLIQGKVRPSQSSDKSKEMYLSNMLTSFSRLQITRIPADLLCKTSAITSTIQYALTLMVFIKLADRKEDSPFLAFSMFALSRGERMGRNRRGKLFQFAEFIIVQSFPQHKFNLGSRHPILYPNLMFVQKTTSLSNLKVILRRCIDISDYLVSEWNEGDNAGEMSPGSSTDSYPPFARIGLNENSGKNVNQITCPERDSNPCHLVSQSDAPTNVIPQVAVLLVLGFNPYVSGSFQYLAPQKNEASKLFKTGCQFPPCFGSYSTENVWSEFHQGKIAPIPSGDLRFDGQHQWLVENETQRIRLRWAGHVARMGESRNAYKLLVGRSEGKRPLGRPRRRWEDNIKMDLREVGCDDREWINLAQERDQWRAYVRAAMNLRVP